MDRTIKPDTLKTELAGKLILMCVAPLTGPPPASHCPARTGRTRIDSPNGSTRFPRRRTSSSTACAAVRYPTRGGRPPGQGPQEPAFIEGGIEGWKAAGGEVIAK